MADTRLFSGLFLSEGCLGDLFFGVVSSTVQRLGKRVTQLMPYRFAAPRNLVPLLNDRKRRKAGSLRT
jgi:hypothetical protein